MQNLTLKAVALLEPQFRIVFDISFEGVILY